jgi:hypothetical protein
MSDKQNAASATEFEFALDEQWTLHSSLLEYVERALEADDGPSPAVELTLLRNIEAGDFRFTPFEHDRLRAILESYVARDDTPELDEEPAASVVDKLDRRCPHDLPA